MSGHQPTIGKVMSVMSPSLGPTGEQLGVLLAAEQQLVRQAHAQAALQTKRASEQVRHRRAMHEPGQTLAPFNPGLAMSRLVKGMTFQGTLQQFSAGGASSPVHCQCG